MTNEQIVKIKGKWLAKEMAGSDISDFYDALTDISALLDALEEAEKALAFLADRLGYSDCPACEYCEYDDKIIDVICDCVYKDFWYCDKPKAICWIAYAKAKTARRIPMGEDIGYYVSSIFGDYIRDTDERSVWHIYAKEVE